MRAEHCPDEAELTVLITHRVNDFLMPLFEGLVYEHNKKAHEHDEEANKHDEDANKIYKVFAEWREGEGFKYTVKKVEQEASESVEGASGSGTAHDFPASDAPVSQGKKKVIKTLYEIDEETWVRRALAEGFETKEANGYPQHEVGKHPTALLQKRALRASNSDGRSTRPASTSTDSNRNQKDKSCGEEHGSKQQSLEKRGCVQSRTTSPPRGQSTTPLQPGQKLPDLSPIDWTKDQDQAAEGSVKDLVNDDYKQRLEASVNARQSIVFDHVFTLEREALYFDVEVEAFYENHEKLYKLEGKQIAQLDGGDWSYKNHMVLREGEASGSGTAHEQPSLAKRGFTQSRPVPPPPSQTELPNRGQSSPVRRTTSSVHRRELPVRRSESAVGPQTHRQSKESEEVQMISEADAAADTLFTEEVRRSLEEKMKHRTTFLWGARLESSSLAKRFDQELRHLLKTDYKDFEFVYPKEKKSFVGILRGLDYRCLLRPRTGNKPVASGAETTSGITLPGSQRQEGEPSTSYSPDQWNRRSTAEASSSTTRGRHCAVRNGVKSHARAPGSPSSEGRKFISGSHARLSPDHHPLRHDRGAALGSSAKKPARNEKGFETRFAKRGACCSSDTVSEPVSEPVSGPVWQPPDHSVAGTESVGGLDDPFEIWKSQNTREIKTAIENANQNKEAILNVESPFDDPETTNKFRTDVWSWARKERFTILKERKSRRTDLGPYRYRATLQTDPSMDATCSETAERPREMPPLETDDEEEGESSTQDRSKAWATSPSRATKGKTTPSRSLRKSRGE
ncbi:hypothetical protein FA10DRAFT_60071 [Acaromyces ingoldii]|uniref:Uncharacterized protein n=1 Tax=Acaromyces ingoldii TaxID=215250 RepID=A0A316YTN0_9BASI|nr:hypothetical protein FA10DRAFT_60071 [Acaromyces ingoldii]PWN91105.1 hypothetical protein FA10DRAFT_60071 [Acaromyces ingoldii]